MSKIITLTKGKETVVDDSDFAILSTFKWTLVSDASGRSYAVRSKMINGKKVTLRMHRVLMGDPHGMQIDHVDGDSLNNQKSNLRVCTQSENLRNTKKHKDNTSGFKGVHYNPNRKKWEANIRFDYRLQYLGRYICPLLAYVAYCRAGRRLFGAFFRPG